MKLTEAGNNLISRCFGIIFRAFLGVAALLIPYPAFHTEASSILPDSLSWSVQSRATFSSGENTPFWLVSNLYGLGSPQLNNGYLRGKVLLPLNPEKKLSLGAEADLVGAWHLPGAFRIQQLYADLKYRKLWLSIGSREFRAKYNNHRLSSGDLLFSGNALPIPQVRVGTFGFAPVWGTKNWFSVNIYLAYGMFTDSNWQKNWVVPDGDHTSNVLFCGRGLSFRIGNDKVYPFTFDVGIEMGTQFGGTVYKDGRIIKMPTGIIDWLKAIVPLSGSDKTPDSEQTNVQGNMNGEYSIAIHWSPANDWHLKAYWEHYFEDHSQLTFEYGLWKDGLYGLELAFPKNPFVAKLVYEYVCTTDQTGAVNNDYTPEIPVQVSGRDGYYTHYLYGAWQNWGMTIGSPFAISPLYNRKHLLTLYNSRFIANHFALEGNPCKGLDWRFLISFTQNWGTYWRPLTRKMNNCSGLVEVTYHPASLKGFFAKGALAWDKGLLLGNNFGGMISLGFEGALSLKR